ncbi:MAG: hypothetical protein KA765_15655 [Thermoflexales bacterium]|nr:hypothetical protein [Thermoflexales bacterium]
MKRFLIVALAGLLLVAVACTSPVVPMAVPTVEPTIPPTLEQLPTVTIKPTQRPSPTPPVIPVPYTIITPTRVVALAVTEITGTISTRGKAAIVWLADGVRHFGILDVDKATVSQLPFSLEDNYKQSGDVVWSPTGAALVYEQHVVEDLGAHIDFDVFGIPVDNSNDGKLLSKSLLWFIGCDWSPQGRYLICSFRPTHRGISLPNCIRVFDSITWEMVCGADEQLHCMIHDDKHVCRPLPLSDGKLWTPTALSSNKKPTPESQETSRRYDTSIINGEIQVLDTANYAITAYVVRDAKVLNVTWSPSK